MLDAIPDLRSTLHAAAPDELADLFDAFDVTAIYDKPNQTPELRATVTPELVPEDEKPRPSNTRSGISSIAGAGFEPATFGL
ncbi:MAG: site-specific recombinase [Solirubrobacteraceae bacterium]|nr:site-specific recombinase [Solirubrobacteraceae bacterium]